jgi:hypothetical protein
MFTGVVTSLSSRARNPRISSSTKVKDRVWVRGGHGLRVALRLVVHPPRSDGVDVAPVRLRLRVHERVAVDLARRRQEVPRPLGLGQPEGVVGAGAAHLQDLDGDALEVDG